jgi:hypothetical protein
MLGLNDTGYIFGLVCLVVACIWFVLWYLKEIKIIK